MINLCLSRKLNKCVNSVVSSINYYPINELTEFTKYCGALKRDLIIVKLNYEKFFNENNSKSIDFYLNKLDEEYGKFENIVFTKDFFEVEMAKCSYNDWCKTQKFVSEYYSAIYNSKIFEKVKNDKKLILKDQYFASLSKITKQIFLIEKLVAMTTKKIMFLSGTKIENLDTNKNYFLLVQRKFNKNWRSEIISNELLGYLNSRLAFSTSANANDNTLFFNPGSYPSYLGAYGYVYDAENFVLCGINFDGMLEENIEGKNLLQKTKVNHTDIDRICAFMVDGVLHEVFSDGLETVTPKSLLPSENSRCNEASMLQLNLQKVCNFEK